MGEIKRITFRCRMDEPYPAVEVPDELLEYLGYTREEFLAAGGSVRTILHPEDYQGFGERLAVYQKRGGTAREEDRLLCKDGTVKWAAMNIRYVPGGQEACFVCDFTDITEEKMLRERVGDLYEKELAYFAELSSKDGSVQGRINLTRNRVESYIATSDVAITHVGDTYDQTIENLAASAVDLFYGDRIRGEMDRMKIQEGYTEGSSEYEYEFLRRRNGGGFFWGRTSFRLQIHPESGDIIVFFYTFDITNRKMQEQLLSRMVELDFDIVLDVDIESDQFRTLSCNYEEEAVLPPKGSFQAEVRLMAKRFMDEQSAELYLSHLDYNFMREHLRNRDSYSFVIEMKDARGGIARKRYKVFYIDRMLGRVCMARTDVTDVVSQELRHREELASALVAAEQANAAKSDFLSRMSHEIRTPMNAIIGMCTIAAQSIGDDEKMADCISRIGISSRFLLSLINDILDMNRIESGKMLLKNEKIPMEEFINGINAICYAQATEKEVDYECVVEPTLGDYYMGDAMKLQQVLINILSNAIKFTGAGGKVTFSIMVQRKVKNDAVLRFVISDTGIGIDENFLPHLFEPFTQESAGVTSSYGGTGLGLAISKSIVDMMDGKITVRSIKDLGSEFTVDVKLGLSEEELRHHGQKAENTSFANLKTLVVDDDVTVCESTVMLLKEIGVRAEWVDSGYKAVERVQRLKDEGKFFDMILIDWKMPEMDGIETARKVRKIVGPDVTIIIITAYDWISIEHEAKLAGVNLLMSKPMFKSSLISAFNRAMGQKEETAPPPKPRNYDFTGRRVLLVEDNRLNTEIATMLLKNKGFEVETAENGLRALEMFSKSEKGYYDAILMDIRMPLMDGLTATVNIRHLTNEDAKTVPILAMTANAFDDDVEKSRAAGMNAHLAKPVDADHLYQTLYDFIFAKKGQ